ncbi:MAG: glycosyltransferase family 4 protein, partial [Alphaproteobacteria bacterium]|nr:glycosyltransferase family 4 protein [Alphaproteobacteria bacterium]
MTGVILAPITLFFAALILSWLGTGGVLVVLRWHGIFDLPNERSSHAQPTPRGGGIAVVGTVLMVWTGWAMWTGVQSQTFVLLAAAVLAGVSFVDDVRGLPPWPRLAAQGAAVAVGLWALPVENLVFQGLLSPMMDRAATGLAWLWFVNLFNFMDGIDGITGLETLCVAGGLALVVPTDAMVARCLAMMGAALGFLRWNWHPARIFLGDIGSVPLGYLLGWLLIGAATTGHGTAALILPLYYLTDATLTLGWRLAR